ncbi:MAG: hypothetical protein M9887_12630, partial [Chitinophagales bacterium]|nr:hypothetical protein [Chitinophagales bacterium]
GIEVGKQSIRKEGSVFNWKAVGGSAVQGAVTGGVAGLTGGTSLLTTATVSGGANVVGGAINRAIQGESTTAINVVTDVAVGAFFGAAGKYLGSKFAANIDKWKKIGSTGKVGEDALKTLGGKPQQYFQTTTGKGGRYIDQLVDGVGHESKVGYTSLTASIKEQIAKDAELISKDKLKGAVWHFFESPVTGKGGASKPLLEELKKNGIDYIIHPVKKQSK